MRCIQHFITSDTVVLISVCGVFFFFFSLLLTLFPLLAWTLHIHTHILIPVLCFFLLQSIKSTCMELKFLSQRYWSVRWRINSVTDFLNFHSQFNSRVRFHAYDINCDFKTVHGIWLQYALEIHWQGENQQTFRAHLSLDHHHSYWDFLRLSLFIFLKDEVRHFRLSLTFSHSLSSDFLLSDTPLVNSESWFSPDSPSFRW